MTVLTTRIDDYSARQAESQSRIVGSLGPERQTTNFLTRLDDMTIEAQLGRIADLLETLVGVLATGGGAATTTATAPAPAAAASKPAAAKKTAKAPAPPPAAESQDDGLGGDDDGLGGDDDGLGGGEDAVSVEDAKAKVLEYRGAITKSKGKEEGLALTRKLLNKYVPELNAITDENAGTVHAAFVAALEALTKKK